VPEGEGLGDHPLMVGEWWMNGGLIVDEWWMNNVVNPTCDSTGDVSGVNGIVYRDILWGYI